MGVESAADLATFFDEDEFGRAAVYTPAGGGAGIAVVVILDEPQKRDDRGAAGVRVQIRTARIRVALLPDDERRGGMLTLSDTGEAFDVRGINRDISGAVAVLNLAPVAS